MSGTSTESNDFEYHTLVHWRGIAALGVLLFHGFGSFSNAGLVMHPNVAWLKSASSIGWFGVHLFFVISGYCIATNVHALARKNIGAGAFLCDRLLRIYPVYWAACLVSIAVNLLAAPFNGVSLGKNLPESWQAILASVFLIEPYLNVKSSFLLVSWSLVYELGFYTIVAIGFGLFRLGLGFWPLAAAGIILALLGLTAPHESLLYVLQFWPEFVIGASVFLSFLYRGHIQLVIVFLLCPLLFVVVVALAFPGSDRLAHLVGAAGFALTLLFLRPLDGRIAGWRFLRWLSWIGTFSYSLYLIHVPLGSRVINLAMRSLAPDGAWILPLQICYWLCSIAIAYLFFLLCERPIEAWRHGLKGRVRASTVSERLPQG